jgi:hypothetical protein
MKYGLVALILSCLLGFTNGAVAETNEDIEYLLAHIADSSCTFIRNGERQDGAEAADYLRERYEENERHIKSVEQFIDRLAGANSLDGQPYVVTCGGRTQTSRDWLNEALVDYQVNK